MHRPASASRSPWTAIFSLSLGTGFAREGSIAFFNLVSPKAVLSFFLLMFAITAHGETRVSFENSIGPIPPVIAATQRAVLAQNANDMLEFGIALNLRNYGLMRERIDRGEVIVRDELEREFLPLQADYDAIAAWLTNNGFTITRNDPSRLIIFAQGTVTQIEQGFQLSMKTVSVNGQNYHAAVSAPSLPPAIANSVLGINHLQPFRQRFKHAVRQPLTANSPPYLVNEVLKAYNGLSMGVTGASQKIAILIDTTAKSSDLTSFWANNSITRTGAIENINVNGGTLPAQSGEETMDVEWTSGIAPGATIRVYASRTLNDADLDACLQRMINDLPTQPNMHQLSISLGLGETYVTPSQFNTDAQLFATLAASGVSIFVSSGDGGSTPDDAGGSTGPLQVEHYASDPSVTAVGGTTLNISSSTGLRTSETVWSGSGGGVSIQFARPSWQIGPGVPAGTKRCVPDVAALADPNTGGYVYMSGVQQYGGTSLSAPIWAGYCALINEARANQGKPPMGLINPSLYPLIGTTSFTDITSGNNATSTSGGKYAATIGYDQCTGIGSPNMSVLLATLVSQAPPAPTIASFTPSSGVENTTVVITGTNFVSVTNVSFNGIAAIYTVNSTTQITAHSPAGATAGPISVTAAGGTATSTTNFSVVAGPPIPLVSSFTPAYALPGASVTLTGSAFSAVTSVSFNGTSASFTVNSNTQITATVPAGATTGPLSVTNSSGTGGSSAGFIVLSGDGSPAISSFTPTSGVAGTTSVTITGTNFVGVSAVTFNGTSATFATTSSTQLSATVPAGATTGRITVTTPFGAATSAGVFTVNVVGVGPVVISQVYGGGGNSSATYQNDFVELYNRSGASVSLSGWTVQYAGATGTTWQSQALGGSISAGHYVLVKLASGGSNGAVLPTADFTGAINMSSTQGKVALMNVATAIASGTSSPVGLAECVDFVGYGAANAFEGTGPAPTTSSTSSAQRKNSGATDTGDNAADFITGSPNPRNSSFGAGTPDLTISLTHTGTFTQGDTADTYLATIGNAGTVATDGAVTVTFALPTGLTATAISGTGWTANLGTLTATRSDALSAGTSYPVLTLTVSVAANAPTSVTTSATVTGGGESNTANDTASDVATINVSGSGDTGGTPAVLASWDVSGQSGYGLSPLTPGVVHGNVIAGGLTRGSGVTTLNTAASRAWGGNGFNAASAASGALANAFATFTITPRTGYTVSFTSLSRFDYRRSTGGATQGTLQYQIGNGAFADITTLAFSSSANTGVSLSPVNLSAVSGLQNIASGAVVTFRIVPFGASASGGTWYVYDVANSTAADLEIQGTVTPIIVGAPDLTLAMSHAGPFKQTNSSKTFTLTATNAGNATSSGLVTVVATLPVGLTATAFSGTGWTTNVATLTATRSDGLGASSAYPALTLTVNVAADAAASLAPSAAISGGTETNTGNNTASDPVNVIQLTPSERWRWQNFGDISGSGTSDDMAIPAGDGLSNLMKYALALDPSIPATLGSRVVGDRTTGAMRLTVTRNPDATDIIYTIEGSADLANWSTDTIVIDQNSSTILQAHSSSTSPQTFLRLKVSR